jgi:hypothetical protein
VAEWRTEDPSVGGSNPPLDILRPASMALPRELLEMKLQLHAGEVKVLQSVEVRLRKCVPGSVSVHIKRSRHIWARKRSPHVFSKSQESFGLEKYSALLVRAALPAAAAAAAASGRKSGPSLASGPRRLFGAASHMIPGATWSWTRRSQSSRGHG